MNFEENKTGHVMSKVVVAKTSPQSVLADIGRLMREADYESALKKDARTILKLNLSWSLFFPACSTSPWQLEGVLRTLKEDNYKDIAAMENKTVVTDPWKGAENNKWLPVLRKCDIRFMPLTDAEWIEYRPKRDLLVLDKKVFPEGIKIPKDFIGSNVLHLPTMKTHGHTQMTGAMKNAFGGLLREARHHCHKHIHEVLVDLLMIQKEIHKGIFTVMDGTVCGNGAGPRTMIPVVKNYILAGEDSVAIDAIAAKMMGFDPMKIRFIKTAHDLGLGCGDIAQIDFVGENISNVNFHFSTKKSPVIFFDQLFRHSFAEPLLFRTWFFNFCIMGSALYHDKFWYPVKGRKFVKDFKKTEWGKLWESY